MAALTTQGGFFPLGLLGTGEVERARGTLTGGDNIQVLPTCWRTASCLVNTAGQIRLSNSPQQPPFARKGRFGNIRCSCLSSRFLSCYHGGWIGAAPSTRFGGRKDRALTQSRTEVVAVRGDSAHASDDSESVESFSHGEKLQDMLRKIVDLRFLGAVIFGVGVVLSTRPGLAWAGVASETISPAGKGLLASAWAGLLAGCLHTLTGPDHLAALAPLCIGRSRLQSAAVGALWGCGHDAGQIIFGLIFLLLKDRLHIELIRTWSSRVVGLTLMTIGGMGIYESQEADKVLAEGASHGMDHEAKIKNDSRNATTFATGVVYGLQPDALLMILPALALPSRSTGFAFLGMFLLGTVVAMGSYTLFLSSCSHALQKKLPGITKRLTFGSSLIAIALGSGVIISEFLGFSLF